MTLNDRNAPPYCYCYDDSTINIVVLIIIIIIIQLVSGAGYVEANEFRPILSAAK